MKRALKIGLIVELKNPKNLFSLLLVALAVFGSIFYVHSQQLGNKIVEQTGDYYAVQSALTKFQIVDASENGNGSDLYKNLNVQKRTVALQVAALKMGKDQMYYRTSLRLTSLREDTYEMEEYEKIADVMPSKIQNDMNKAYYSHMVETDGKIDNNPLQYFPFLIFIFSIIGFGWYALVSLYTSSILLDDFEHSSVVKGFPIPFHQYMFSKCMTAFINICLFIVVIFICSIPLIFKEGWGSLNTPIAIYLGKPIILTAWQFILVVIFYMLLVSVFVMLFSIILNVWLKNMYLTLFVHMICFFLPMIFPALISYIPFNPFHFMNFNDILTGQPLALDKPIDISIIHGIILIVFVIVLLMTIIKKFFSIGKISRV